MSDGVFSTAKSSEKYSIGKLQLMKTELILCIIGLISLIILITVAILLGAGIGSQDKEVEETSVNIIVPNECIEPQCLEASSTLAFLRNTSVHPCNNFYQYACSSKIWSTERLKPDEREFSTLHQLEEENEERVRNALGSPIRRSVEWSAELRMKKFYQSCLNTYGNSAEGPKDFIAKILTPAGGWYMINTMNEQLYDITNALTKVHSNFWLTSLFSVTVARDDLYNQRNILEVSIYEVNCQLFYSFQYFLKLFIKISFLHIDWTWWANSQMVGLRWYNLKTPKGRPYHL